MNDSCGNILEVLQELNFTEYEAKVYVSLLEKSPLTGYAAAAQSGVPRSKVYEVLGSLTERGDITVSHESPVLYSPLAPEELIAKRRRQAARSFKTAETALRRYSGGTRNRDNIWNISGREAILDRVRQVVGAARSRVLAELWPEEIAELRPELEKAADQGIEIIIVSYGEAELAGAAVYPHDASTEITAEYGGRWVVVSADNSEVVAGTVSFGEDSRAAWTTHPGLVIPITEVIVHDLYIMEILGRHREIVEKSFGPNLADLRRRFNVDSSGPSIADKVRPLLKEKPASARPAGKVRKKKSGK